MASYGKAIDRRILVLSEKTGWGASQAYEEVDVCAMSTETEVTERI